MYDDKRRELLNAHHEQIRKEELEREIAENLRELEALREQYAESYQKAREELSGADEELGDALSKLRGQMMAKLEEEIGNDLEVIGKEAQKQEETICQKYGVERPKIDERGIADEVKKRGKISLEELCEIRANKLRSALDKQTPEISKETIDNIVEDCKKEFMMSSVIQGRQGSLSENLGKYQGLRRIDEEERNRSRIRREKKDQKGKDQVYQQQVGGDDKDKPKKDDVKPKDDDKQSTVENEQSRDDKLKELEQKINDSRIEIEETIAPEITRIFTVGAKTLNSGIKVGEDIEDIITKYGDIANDPEYSDELRQKKLEDIYSEFEKQNAAVLANMSDDDKATLRKEFDDAMKPLTEKIKEMRGYIEEKDSLLQEREQATNEDSKEQSTKYSQGVEPAKYLPTPQRAAQALDCKESELKKKITQRMKEGVEALEAFNKSDREYSKEERVAQRQLLNAVQGGMTITAKDLEKSPESHVDLSTPERCKKSALYILAANLDIPTQGKNEEELNQELDKKIEATGITKPEEISVLKSHMVNLVQDRLVLGMTKEMKHDNIEQDVTASLERVQKLNRDYQAALEYGICKPDFSDKGKKRKDKVSYDDWAKNLEKNAHRIDKGLYMQIQEDGDPLYSMTEVNEDNVAEIVARNQTNSGITWYNLDKNEKKLAETESLKNWKRAYFDDGKDPKITPLSQCMPDKPGSWAEWVKNIDAKKDHSPRFSASNSRTLKKQLVRDVVGEDPQKLQEFWNDIAKSKDPKLIANMKSWLSKDQKKLLGESYQKELREVAEKIDQLSNKTELSVGNKNKLEELKEQREELKANSELLKPEPKPGKKKGAVVLAPK